MAIQNIWIERSIQKPRENLEGREENRKEEKWREENAGESERGKGKEPRSGHWLRQYEAESGDRREWFGGRERGRPLRVW